MAKAGTERIKHKGSGVDFYIDINFYTKGKYFQVTNFPKQIIDWYGAKLTRENDRYNFTGEITAKSYDECVTEANRVFNEYYNQQVSEEKIIAYKLLINKPANDNHLGKKHEMHFGLRLALSIEHIVLYRIKVGEETFISRADYEASKQPDQGISIGGPTLYREDSSQGFRDYKKLPYTQQTHDFFVNVENNLEKMINNIELFFGTDEGHLLENIVSNKLLK